MSGDGWGYLLSQFSSPLFSFITVAKQVWQVTKKDRNFNATSWSISTFPVRGNREIRTQGC
jgi:hypothetical protein